MDNQNGTQATIASEPVASENLIGRQFGPYQIVGALGEGGMATVFKAFQPAVERHIALKVLPRHFANDREFTARFEREAKLLAQLQHPHILPVFDYGQADGYSYIVMPFVKRGTLSDVLNDRPQPLPRIRQVITQIGDALNYAHARGLVHRDVKPSNVLLDEENNCLLTDFGLAKMVETSVNLTHAGSVLGTPAYMSPEQCSGKPLDARSDIYALGIILYEMGTGRVPFKAETPIALLAKHIYDAPEAPQKLNPDLPESLQLVILKALEKKPENRFQTAAEMVGALQSALPEGPAAVRSCLAKQTLKTAAKQPAVKGRLSAVPTWAWGTTGAAGLAAAGLLFITFSNRGPGSREEPTPQPLPAAPAAVAPNNEAPASAVAQQAAQPRPQPQAPATPKPQAPAATEPPVAQPAAAAETVARQEVASAPAPAARETPVAANEAPPPPATVATEREMALLPAGTNSGKDPDFGAYSLSLPEPLWIDIYEVSKKKWDSVYAWAVTNGYRFSNAGKAKGPDHPMVEISWLDCAKWCNARSEMEGLTPCYLLGGNVFKTSEAMPDCRFQASGYRLPTVAEWRYAARGGQQDKRFPWGDTARHAQANYTAGAGAYDGDSTKGPDPRYAKDGEPFTCPVDTFPPNGYGLYNMAGNVAERCWDISGLNRCVQGGSWKSDASCLCIGSGGISKPYHASDTEGFRTVRLAAAKLP